MPQPKRVRSKPVPNPGEKAASKKETSPKGVLQEERDKESRWEESFDKSWDVLEELGAKAVKDYKQGKTLPLDSILS